MIFSYTLVIFRWEITKIIYQSKLFRRKPLKHFRWERFSQVFGDNFEFLLLHKTF